MIYIYHLITRFSSTNSINLIQIKHSNAHNGSTSVVYRDIYLQDFYENFPEMFSSYSLMVLTAHRIRNKHNNNSTENNTILCISSIVGTGKRQNTKRVSIENFKLFIRLRKEEQSERSQQDTQK